jgi:iron complex outermembrane recepter protein
MGIQSRNALLSAAAFASVAIACNASAQSQANGSETTAIKPGGQILEEVVVTGTRRSDRTVAQSLSPIEVYQAEDLTRQGSADMLQKLSVLNPTFNVRYFPSADGSAFVRPPTLRNLPPDDILVLVNGKRWHRSALLQENGGILSGGSQGPDISQIPAIAIESVEVLKDGASAQYGSDAIAGVINFRLKTKRDGVLATAKYGSFFAGDGLDTELATNIGLPLGSEGFFNVSLEYIKSDETSRGVTRASALALATTYPSIEVADPAQVFGNTNVKGHKLFINSSVPITDNSRLYFFGSYGYTDNNNGFNYRLSQTVTGPNADGTGVETFAKNSVFNTIYTTLNPDGSGVITGSTFNFSEVYPGGFTPQFYGTLDDMSAVAGYKGETGSQLTYDFSVGVGRSKVDYSMKHSLNPSLGPDSPTDFEIGTLEERESAFNADFTYPVNVGLAQPFMLAGGAELRRDQYLIGAGELASYEAGPYARVPLVNADGSPVLDPSGSQVIAVQGVGSNGFSGFGPRDVVDNARHSAAAYLDFEGDLTEKLSIGVAGRYEHFSDFGDSFTGKLSGRYAFTDKLAFRATGSTGFRAPAPAQLYTHNTVTFFTATASSPVDIEVLPTTNPAAVYFGAKPLKPENSYNYSAGFVLTPTENFEASLDVYQIKLDDRIGYSQNFAVTDADRPALEAAGVADWATIGFVKYFTNAFATRTRGVDLVGTHRHSTDTLGELDTTISVGYNKTKVTSYDPAVIGTRNIEGIENINPEIRGTVSETWFKDPISVLLRLRYYGDYSDRESTGILTPYGSQTNVDLELSYKLRDVWTVSLGAENILDNYPGKIPGRYTSTGGIFNGQVYPTDAPAGYNGGFWYLKLTGDFK